MDKKTKASIEIENIITHNQDLTYVEAVLQWMETNELDFHEIKKYIAAPLLEKIKNECNQSNLLKTERTNTISLNEFF